MPFGSLHRHKRCLNYDIGELSCFPVKRANQHWLKMFTKYCLNFNYLFCTKLYKLNNNGEFHLLFYIYIAPKVAKTAHIVYIISYAYFPNGIEIHVVAFGFFNIYIYGFCKEMPDLQNYITSTITFSPFIHWNLCLKIKLLIRVVNIYSLCSPRFYAHNLSTC